MSPLRAAMCSGVVPCQEPTAVVSNASAGWQTPDAGDATRNRMLQILTFDTKCGNTGVGCYSMRQYSHCSCLANHKSLSGNMQQTHSQLKRATLHAVLHCKHSKQHCTAFGAVLLACAKCYLRSLITLRSTWILASTGQPAVISLLICVRLLQHGSILQKFLPGDGLYSLSVRVSLALQ